MYVDNVEDHGGCEERSDMALLVDLVETVTILIMAHVPGVPIFHAIPKMDFEYSHFSWEKHTKLIYHILWLYQ